MENVKINPRLQTIIPPLTQDEFNRLEANILEDGGVREPIIVWIDTIVGGHNRWRIIQEHPYLPYKIKYMDFPDIWAAIVWMCYNQLGYRNITDAQKTILIGEAYEAQKKTRGGSSQRERGEDGRFTSFPPGWGNEVWRKKPWHRTNHRRGIWGWSQHRQPG